MANYFSFARGIIISDETINDWLTEILNELLYSGADWVCHTCGDTVVFGHILIQDDEVSEYEFHVCTSNGFMKISLPSDEIEDHEFDFRRANLV